MHRVKHLEVDVGCLQSTTKLMIWSIARSESRMLSGAIVGCLGYLSEECEREPCLVCCAVRRHGSYCSPTGPHSFSRDDYTPRQVRGSGTGLPYGSQGSLQAKCHRFTTGLLKLNRDTLNGRCCPTHLRDCLPHLSQGRRWIWHGGCNMACVQTNWWRVNLIQVRKMLSST